MGLIVRLNRLDIPLNLLRIINDWLSHRYAKVVFGRHETKKFKIQIGRPQGSSLSPYIFVVYHSDLVKQIGAHSCHIFADDLSVLIRAPIEKKLNPLVKYLQNQGNLISKRISDYSEKWKQPINVDKTAIHLFHSQITVRPIEVRMLGKKLKQVSSFKYLGFTWTSKLSLKPTVDKCLENIQKSLNKLKWLRCGHVLSTKILRQGFFTYTFPHFAWLFPLHPSLPPYHAT